MAAKYEAIEWMMVQMTTLGPMFGQHVHYVRFAPKGNDYSQSRYTTQVHRVLEAMDQRLAENPGSAAPTTASPTSPPIPGRATSPCCSARPRRRNTRTS